MEPVALAVSATGIAQSLFETEIVTANAFDPIAPLIGQLDTTVSTLENLDI